MQSRTLVVHVVVTEAVSFTVHAVIMPELGMGGPEDRMRAKLSAGKVTGCGMGSGEILISNNWKRKEMRPGIVDG